MYSDSVGVPTVGVGYALLTRGSSGLYSVPTSNLTTDFAGIYTFTSADLALLSKIAGDLNTHQLTAAKSDLANRDAGTLSINLTDAQSTAVFTSALDRNVDVGIPSDIQDQLAGTYELVTLEDLAYNGPALIGGGLLTALRETDPIAARVDSWYQIVFATNSGASKSIGVENRRLREGDEFGLYSQGNQPSQTDGGKEATTVAQFLNDNYAELLSYLNQFYADGIAKIDSFFQPAETALLNVGIYFAHPRGASGDNQAIVLNNNIFELINAGSYAGTISGFVSGDTLDIANVGTATAAVLGANNILNIIGVKGGTIELQLDPTHNYAGAEFLAAGDGKGGTNVKLVGKDQAPSSETTYFPTYRTPNDFTDGAYYTINYSGPNGTGLSGSAELGVYDGGKTATTITFDKTTFYDNDSSEIIVPFEIRQFDTGNYYNGINSIEVTGSIGSSFRLEEEVNQSPTGSKGQLALEYTGSYTIYQSALEKIQLGIDVDAGGVFHEAQFYLYAGRGENAVSGVAEDGVLAGATVFADANGNGVLDSGEASTITDGSGAFTLVGGTGTLVASGGTDVATGLAFKGVLEAPFGSTVITPLTTLVVELAASGLADPVQALDTALGIPAGTNLTTLDAEAGAFDGNATATTVFAVQTQVANIFSLITGAGGNLASAGARAAIASAVTAGAASFLIDPTALSTLAIAAGVSSSEATAVGAIGSATNALIAATVASGQPAASVVTTIEAVAIVAQGAATTSLMQAVVDPSMLTAAIGAYTGSSLVQAVRRAGGTVASQEVSLGSGPDQLALKISEEAYQGDAQYTVSVDGHQIGGTQTALAAHGAASDTVLINGDWGSGAHTFTVDFLNDLYGGSASTDRNIYVDGATYNGSTVSGAQAALYGNGPLSLEFDKAPSATPTSIGSGPNQLALSISEDAYQGDAQYMVSVDGQQIGGPQTTFAAHGAASDTLLVNGDWGSGPHTVTVDFLNDLYGGTAETDRNLYVDGASYNGSTVSGAQVALYGSGPVSLEFNQAPSTTPTNIGAGADQLSLDLSEDAYQGDAQYTVSVDGHQIGGPQTTFAAHGKASDKLLVNGDWAPGDHTFTVNFLNDRYGGAASTDRNLYLDSATYNGATVSGAHAAFYQNGSQRFVFHSATASG